MMQDTWINIKTEAFGIECEPRKYQYPKISAFTKIIPVEASSFSTESAHSRPSSFVIAYRKDVLGALHSARAEF